MSNKLGYLIEFEGGECSGKDTHLYSLARKLNELGYVVNCANKKPFTFFQEPGATPTAELIRIILKNKLDTDYELSDRVKTDFDLNNAQEEFSKDIITKVARNYLENAMKISNTPIKNEIIQFIINGELQKNSQTEQIMKKLRKEKEPSEEFFKKYLTKEVLPPIAQEYLFFAARNILFETSIKQSLQESDFTIINRGRLSTQVYQGHVFNPSRIQTIRQENITATDNIFPDLILYFDIPIKEMFTRQAKLNKGRPDFFDGQKKEFHEKVRQGYINELKYYKSLPTNDPKYDKMIRVSTLPKLKEVEEQVFDLITTKLQIDK